MKSTLRIKAKVILTGTLIATALAIVAAATVAAPSVQQIIPSAYAASAAGGSAITEGACSTGSFADSFLASIAASCGPDFSGSAAGEVAICRSDDGSVAIGIKGTCSVSN